MMCIELFPLVGDFGEDKDIAAELRESKIKPAIANKRSMQIDFDGVTLATQSFMHALISDVLRINGEDALDFLEFKNCVSVVQGIVSNVVQYSLDTLADEEENARQLKRDEEKSSNHSVS